MIPFGVHLGFCSKFLVIVRVVYSFFVVVLASVARAFQQVLLFVSASNLETYLLRAIRFIFHNKEEELFINLTDCILFLWMRSQGNNQHFRATPSDERGPASSTHIYTHNPQRTILNIYNNTIYHPARQCPPHNLNQPGFRLRAMRKVHFA